MVPPGRQTPCAKSNLAAKMYHAGAIRGLDAAIRVLDSTDNLDYSGSRCGISWVLLARVGADVRGKVRTKALGNAVRAETVLFVVLKFFVPGHLNRFELSFVR